LGRAGSEEVEKPKLESRPGVEHKLREDRIQTLKLSWLQGPEGSSKLLWPKRVRDTVSFGCWNFP